MHPLGPEVTAIAQAALLRFLRLADPALFGALWVVLFLALDALILWFAEILIGRGHPPEVMRTVSTWAALAFYGLYLASEFARSLASLRE